MAEETEEVKIQEEDDHLFAQRQDVIKLFRQDSSDQKKVYEDDERMGKRNTIHSIGEPASKNQFDLESPSCVVPEAMENRIKPSAHSLIIKQSNHTKDQLNKRKSSLDHSKKHKILPVTSTSASGQIRKIPKETVSALTLHGTGSKPKRTVKIP